MQVTGKVTKVVKRKNSSGNAYVSVTLDDIVTFKYLHTYEYLPKKGENITLSGVPMVGNRANVNIGGVRVQLNS